MVYTEQYLKALIRFKNKPDWFTPFDSPLLSMMMNKIFDIKKNEPVVFINFSKKNLNYIKINGNNIICIALVKDNAEANAVKHIWNINHELFDYVFTVDEFIDWIDKMVFKKVLMNPPYSKNLHLKILNEVIKHLSKDGVCVNLSPVPRLTSIRNLWSSTAIKKFKDISVFKHLVSCDQLNGADCIKIFGAGMQQHMGITVYSGTDKNHTNPEKYVDTFGLPAYLVKKIMNVCLNDTLKTNIGHGNYCLPISGIHGHVDGSDFLNIMSMTYEDQLKSKGVIKVYFESEKDRHDFYDFWMSKYGKFLVRMWKVDTHVMENFIPYFWCTNIIDFQKYFSLSDDEMKLIEKNINETMTKYI